MRLANRHIRKARRLTAAADALAVLSGHVVAGTQVPAGNYPIRVPLVLTANQSLLLHADATIRPADKFQGPLVEIAGSDVSIEGGTISGATVVTGWREDGDGLWSAPYPLNSTGPCFSLIRNGEVKRISKWPQMRPEPIGSLRMYGPIHKASTPAGALDAALAGGGSWTAAICVSANLHPTGVLFQVGGETTVIPKGVSVRLSSNWNGTVGTFNVIVNYAEGENGVARTLGFSGRSVVGGLTVMLAYDSVTKRLSLSVDNAAVSSIVPLGINLPAGRKFTLSGNYDDADGDSGHRCTYVSTLAVWGRALSDAERLTFWNNRLRFLWSELPAGLKTGCVGFWGFDQYADMGHADVGPDLIPRGEFSPSTTHGIDDGTVGLCPTGQFWMGNTSTWRLGSTYPDNSSWRPNAPVPANETFTRIVPTTPSWTATKLMNVTLNADNQSVLGIPIVSGFTAVRSVIFHNVKSTMVAGTWCEKPDTGRVYYYPEAGETLLNSTFEVPSACILLSRDGDPPDTLNRYDIEVPPYPLRSNITVLGTRFENSRHYTKTRQPSTIEDGSLDVHLPQHAGVNLFAYVNNVLIENCFFFNLGNRRGISCDCRSDGFTVRGCRFDHMGCNAIAFAYQPGSSAGSENKNTLIEFCSFTRNGSVIATTYGVVHYGMCDGFVFRNNFLQNIPYVGIGSHPASPSRISPWQGHAWHTHQNVTISNNYFDRYLTMASDGAAIYFGSEGGAPRNRNHRISNNLITHNEGYAKSGTSGYPETAIYFDIWAKYGYRIEDNVILNTYSGRVLYALEWGPNDFPISGNGSLDLFYRNNLLSNDLPFHFQFYDFNPDTLVEITPKTSVSIFVDESERRLQLLYGTFGIEDAASGNVSYEGESFGAAANALVADWHLANNTGTAGYLDQNTVLAIGNTALTQSNSMLIL